MSKALSERCKVVVRNLPPALAADAFQGFIDKHFEGTYDWFAYYQGKVSLKRTVFSRAFINFSRPDSVIEFKAKFDGHVFVSNRGTQYRCSVEYAPFQKVPTPNPKKLAMEGTIEKDPDYQAFLAQLEEGPQALPTATAQLEAAEAARGGEETGPVVTALMAFLQKKYESQPFTGRRGSKASRRRDLPSVGEEQASKGKAGKGSRGSRAAAATDAAAAAAAAGAVEKALKGTRHKPSSSRHKQDDAAAGEEPSSKGRRQPVAKAGRPRDAADAAGSSADPAADRPARAGRQGHSKRGAAGEAGGRAAAASGEDDEAKRAAAAALAATSAANGAARAPRVRPGFAPGAGGRLLAAALPKPKSSEAPGTAAAAAAKDKPDKGQKERGSGSRRKGGHTAAGGAAAGEAAAEASAAAAALEQLHVGDGAASSRSGGRPGGGRRGGKAAAGSTGQAGSSQAGKQQQWMPKASGAG